MTLTEIIQTNIIQQASTSDMVLKMGSLETYREDISELWKRISVIRQLQKMFDTEIVKVEYELDILTGCINYINYLLGEYKRSGSVFVYNHIILTNSGETTSNLPEINFRFTDLLDAPTEIEPLKFVRGNASGTRLEFFEIPTPILTEDIAVSNPDIGLTLPFTFTNGTTLTEAWKQLVQKTINPTFVNPSFSLSNNAGLREVGETFNITLTFNFNRGEIRGDIVGGVWSTTALQSLRAGAANNYILGGVSAGTNNTRLFSVTATLGINSFTGTVSYVLGIQPYNSLLEDFDSPFPAGTSAEQGTSFTAAYKIFFGPNSIATNSAEVRALSGSTFGTTFQIILTPGQTQMSFAYPASRADIIDSSVKYVEGFNANVGNTFTKSLFNVNDAAGNPVAYKIYTVELPAPEAGQVTYNVTLP